MSSSLRRGALAAAAIAFPLASLAACGAGNGAQTLEIKPDNAATSVGDIKVQNAVVITQPDRESTGPAAVSATVFNAGKTAQTLESIQVDGGESAELKPVEGKSLTVPAGGSLVIGGQDNAAATIAGGSEAVRDGDAHKITFTFSKTGDVSLKAFVVPAESYFSEWGPSEVPTSPDETENPATSSASADEETSEQGTEDDPTGNPGEEAGESSDAGTPTDAASASADSH
ncbi:DUF461 domain-containing protein [Streptomyces sp. CRN 30]|uniref:DUF461 domain-containing protein n=1 Tax=Streptomyces sp. CRN 30 TaxID=3075613 RepID=UPI002A83C981|nr:DUF461 domain-containing protein [Streptomyces sp. CRN 30]